MKIARHITTTLLLGATSVHGGTVSFDPGFVEVDPAGGVTNVMIDVSVVAETLDTFGFLSILFQWDDNLTVLYFVPGFEPVPYICYFCVTPNQLFLEGIFSPAVHSTFIGTFVVSADGAPPGDYAIEVPPPSSLANPLGESEPLFGSVTIHVIPEPATLVLLTVGLSLKFRRPKTA